MILFKILVVIVAIKWFKRKTPVEVVVVLTEDEHGVSTFEDFYLLPVASWTLGQQERAERVCKTWSKLVQSYNADGSKSWSLLRLKLAIHASKNISKFAQQKYWRNNAN